MKSIGEIIHNKTFPINVLDSRDKRLYYENSVGFWAKQLYSKDGSEIYYEDSDGHIIENKYYKYYENDWKNNT